MLTCAQVETFMNKIGLQKILVEREGTDLNAYRSADFVIDLGVKGIAIDYYAAMLR